jgi:hypothetical protein
VASLSGLALASGFAVPLSGRALLDRPPADGVAGGENVAPADDEGVPEGVAPGDCVTGESEITGLGSFCLRYRACRPARDDCAGEGAGDNVPRDVAAGEDAAGDGATGYDGAVDDTLDAPADVDPGGIGPLHIVAGVPA